MNTRFRALLSLCVFAALGCFATPASAGVTSWTNSAGGDWFQNSNWSNGAPGQLDDAVVDLPGSYTIDLAGGAANVNSLTIFATNATLLNEGFLSVLGTLDLRAGTLDGNGTVVVNGLLRFERGTIRGGGTLEINGDLTFDSPVTKRLSGRSVTTFGNVSWQEGDIAASGGVSWHQVAGTLCVDSNATWSDDGSGTLIFDGAVQATNDGTLPPFLGGTTSVTSIDSGRILRIDGGGTLAGSIVTLGTLAPTYGLYSFQPTSGVSGSGDVSVASGAEVLLDTDVSMSGGSWIVGAGGSLSITNGRQFSQDSSLKVLDGSVRFSDGAAAMPSRVPTLELAGGNLRIDGTLDVDTSLDHSLGTVVVTGLLDASGVRQSGGVTVSYGSISFAGIYDLSGGSLVAGATDLDFGSLPPGLVELDSVIQTGGALAADFGTICTQNTYQWRGGSWNNTGTLVFQGPLSIDGPATKTLAGPRVVSHGDVDWNDGDVAASDFTWRQLDGPFTMAAADGRWGPTGSLDVSSSLTTVAGGSLTFTPILRIRSTGTLYIGSSSFFKQGGSLVVGGALRVDGDLTVDGVQLVCGDPGGGVPGCASSTFVDGGSLTIIHGLTHDYSDPAAWSFSPGSTLRVAGGTGADVEDWPRWTAFEIAGEDVGPMPTPNNFELSELSIAPGARMLLEDRVDNLGIGIAEALYVDTLVFDDAAGRINLNGRRLYYNQLFGDPAQIVDEPVIGVGVSKNDALGAVTLAWTTNGFPPFRVLRSSLPAGGFAEITPQGGTGQSTWDDGVLFDGQSWYYLVDRDVP